MIRTVLMMMMTTMMMLPQGRCRPERANYFQRYGPAGSLWDPASVLAVPDRLFTMADVLGLLGNRSLAFVGDSLTFQVSYVRLRARPEYA
jgi:hypothetical protein